MRINRNSNNARSWTIQTQGRVHGCLRAQQSRVFMELGAFQLGEVKGAYNTRDGAASKVGWMEGRGFGLRKGGGGWEESAPRFGLSEHSVDFC